MRQGELSMMARMNERRTEPNGKVGPQSAPVLGRLDDFALLALRRNQNFGVVFILGNNYIVLRQ